MSATWSDRSRFLAWTRVEAAASEEWARAGIIPKGDWTELKKAYDRVIQAGGVDPEAVARHVVQKKVFTTY